MPPRLLLFTGAPDASTLDWEENGLLSSFSGHFSRFASFDVEQEPSVLQSNSSLQPVWRFIPLERQHLATGHSQDHRWAIEYKGAEFFTADSFLEEMTQPSLRESQRSTDQVLSQFYEQSYAVYEDITSSRLAAASDTGSSIYSENSFDATYTPHQSQSHPFPMRKDIPVAGHVSNLEDIPKSAYLDSIQPQTMTANIIVGVISVPKPRAIKTKREVDVELLEILVGDETKSGFGVNFWLSSFRSNANNGVRNIICGLRPRDIVLMRNVALNSFRGKVYGQSLRKDLTKVDLLYRTRFDMRDLCGCYSAIHLASGETSDPQIRKTKRVREWVLKCVGAATVRRARGRSEIIREMLPPDTQ